MRHFWIQNHASSCTSWPLSLWKFLKNIYRGSTRVKTIRPFQERHVIARACVHTHAKVFRRDKLHTQMKPLATRFSHKILCVQDMWLYCTCLKQHFFSPVFFRFLSVLTMYEKIFKLFASVLPSNNLIMKYQKLTKPIL